MNPTAHLFAAILLVTSTLPAFAQTTRVGKTAVKRKATAATAAAKPAIKSTTADNTDGLDKDLPEIDETEFKNPHLYHPGQSSLLLAFGVSFPNQAEAAPRPIYGAEYFYRYRHNLTFGVSALYAGEHTKTSVDEFKFNVVFLGVTALYDAPEQFVPGMHIGPAFYLVHVDYISSHTAGTPPVTDHESALTIAIGPKIGFKFPLFYSIASQIETAILYSPPIKNVGSFLTVNFSSGIRYDF